MTIDKELYEDIKFGTNIITDKEYLETILAISEVATDMVTKTLGPYGSTTIIDDGVFTYPTKDGWSVLKRLQFNDPVFNTIYNILKQVSFDVVTKVGDGTTSAFIGASYFIKEVLQVLKKYRYRQADFLKALNKITADLVEKILSSRYVRYIDISGDYSDIAEIANISANGNREVAEIIHKIFKETNNPNIYVSLDSGDSLTYEIQKGYKLDCNPINLKAYKNSDDGKFIMNERSLVAIFDHTVSYNEHDKLMSGLFSYAAAEKKMLYILAPHFDDVLLNIIKVNLENIIASGQAPNIMIIQIPFSTMVQKQYLHDLVMLTSAQVFDYGKVRAYRTLVHNMSVTDEKEKIEDALLQTSQYSFEAPEDIIKICVGKLNTITVDKDYILVKDYEDIVNKQVYNNVLKEAEDSYISLKNKANKSTVIDKDYLNSYQRYLKLTGNVGVIKVGGLSELEKMCLKDTVDDAVLACKSAYEYGYVTGLNISTLKVIYEEWHNLKEPNKDNIKEYAKYTLEHKIYRMLYKVFFSMSTNVLLNKYEKLEDEVTCYNVAGDEISLKPEAILDHAVKNGYGFDLTSDSFENINDCFVVNSVQTDVEVLKGMVSILSTVLTSSQFLTINRSYDRQMSQKTKTDMFLKSKELQTSTVVNTIIDTLGDRFGRDVVKRIVSTIAKM